MQNPQRIWAGVTAPSRIKVVILSARGRPRLPRLSGVLPGSALGVVLLAEGDRKPSPGVNGGVKQFSDDHARCGVKPQFIARFSPPLLKPLFVGDKNELACGSMDLKL